MILDFFTKRIFPKGVVLPCDQESCSCGTKKCAFWKSLENDKENHTKVTIEGLEWCKTCITCGFPIVEGKCVCSKQQNYTNVSQKEPRK